MKNKITKTIFGGFVLALVFLFMITPVVVIAAPVSGGPKSLTDITTIVTTVVNWFQGIVFLIGILMIIWAGLTYMLAGGDDAKMTEARKRLIWGIIGIGVAIFAYVAKAFILSLMTP